MKYQSKQMNGYKLHFAKSDKFKEIRVRVVFRRKLLKEEITISSFLSSILTYSTKKYPTQRLLAMQKQMLYGAGITSGLFRIGKQIEYRFDLSVINDRFTEKGNLEESIKLLISMIFDPKVNDNKFDNNDFKIIYGRILENIDKVKEDKGFYAVQKMREILDNKRAFSYLMCGNKKDLDKITPSNLYSFYKKVLKSSEVDIFVAGDIKFSEVISLFENNFPRVDYNAMGEIVDKNHNFRKRILRRYEQDDVKQTTLVVGGKLENITQYESQYVSYVFNKVFGSSSTSKLFSTIREKYSLCYSISSVINSEAHIFYVTAGIDRDKAKMVVKLIKQSLSEMEKGIIDEEDIKNAKTSFIEQNKSIEENSSVLICDMQDVIILNFDDAEASSRRIEEVTESDLREFAKKMKIEVIYMLHGGDSNEEN